jgi:hypothetical protein
LEHSGERIVLTKAETSQRRYERNCRYFGSANIITFTSVLHGPSEGSILVTLNPGTAGSLNGTTLKVYRYIYRQAGKPVGVHEVQSGLGLSSPSVAHYHIRKLVEEGFVKETSGGYMVDRLLFENMIRIRNSIIPFQTTFLAIFLTSLGLLLTLFRAPVLSGEYVFAISMNILAIGIFSWETLRALGYKYR